MNADQLRGHLEPLIMAVLEAGPAHGYAIAAALHERSDGDFDVPEGTIYPALHRLERSGAISSRRETVGGRERRVYRLTPRGRTALRARRREWSSFAATVSHVLGVSPA